MKEKVRKLFTNFESYISSHCAQFNLSVGRRVFFNPYHHPLGAWLGDWDVAVVLKALEMKGLVIQRHIIYIPTSPQLLEESLSAFRNDIESGQMRTIGLLFNEVRRNFLISSGRHWFAVAQAYIDDSAPSLWFNRDSSLHMPELVFETQSGTPGSLDALVSLMRNRVIQQEAHIFHVIKSSGQVSVNQRNAEEKIP